MKQFASIQKQFMEQAAENADGKSLWKDLACQWNNLGCDLLQISKQICLTVDWHPVPPK